MTLLMPNGTGKRTGVNLNETSAVAAGCVLRCKIVLEVKTNIAFVPRS